MTGRRSLDSLSQCYVRGVKIDWAAFDRDYRPRKVDLPAYPYQRAAVLVGSGRDGGRSGHVDDAARRPSACIHWLVAGW